jgi:hypothetical protein
VKGAAEINCMQNKTGDSQVARRYTVSASAHSRVVRSELSRRMSLNPRMSTKQRSDMDRRASFSILYPTP